MGDDKDDYAEDCYQYHAVLKTGNDGDMIIKAGDKRNGENSDNLIRSKTFTDQL